MYGIILDSMADCLQQLYGKETWEKIVGSADISNTVFTTHKIYDEQIIQMIAKAAADVTSNSTDVIMEQTGRHFITYIDDIRNDRIIKVLGRTFKDFLNGLDSMHEYYRFNFPDLQPPSFQVSEEDEKGMQLEYRSRRTFTGFMHYVRGLMYEIAANFFHISDINVKIVQHGFSGDVLCAVFRLDFVNEDFTRKQEIERTKREHRKNNELYFPSHAFFEIFPYHVVFDERLVIHSTGHGLGELYSNLVGKRINENFYMTRPLGYDLTWENVVLHRNNVFELTSVKSAGRGGSRVRMNTHFIKLRGQMLYVQEWNCVMFLSTLLLDDLNALSDMGIFVNDLTFHDLSRDMVMHGPQQRTEYKLALDLEQGKAARYEEIIETLDAERRKTDDLLYSMIPKEIAKSLRQGNTTVSLCEKYSEVTVLFSDIVNFASIYMHIAPHEIVIILNMMVSVFDILCDKFGIYKVETVADGFMAVSGAPSYTDDHAKNMADMAFEMLNGIKTVKDPNTTISIQIRIGLHCGSVIAGLVGHKIPHFCLFGDTVNIASKMEATGEGQRIQISQICKEKLEGYEEEYKTEEKGFVEIKGCGNIMTYWLNGVKNEIEENAKEEEKPTNERKDSEATETKPLNKAKRESDSNSRTNASHGSPGDTNRSMKKKQSMISKLLDSEEKDGNKRLTRKKEVKETVVDSEDMEEKEDNLTERIKSSVFRGGDGSKKIAVVKESASVANSDGGNKANKTTEVSPSDEKRDRGREKSREATSEMPSKKMDELLKQAPVPKPKPGASDEDSDRAFENLLRVIRRFDGQEASNDKRIVNGTADFTTEAEIKVLKDIKSGSEIEKSPPKSQRQVRNINGGRPSSGVQPPRTEPNQPSSAPARSMLPSIVISPSNSTKLSRRAVCNKSNATISSPSRGSTQECLSDPSDSPPPRRVHRPPPGFPLTKGCPFDALSKLKQATSGRLKKVGQNKIVSQACNIL